MSLAAGDRLGPYAILAPIGAGGMGEVYRARDTKLDREVAIKVLPSALAQHPDRLARFEREAKVLAALNHPNIAMIFGIEDRAIVMELVEGPTLADRICTGPIPLEESLKIAAQIADALEVAHERGIVHRDLKPANVKVRDDGTVKVLDFGLATAVQSGAGQPGDGANSPTLTTGATEAGVILGTAAYMSPEQAAGKPVDRRADIWSFGVVLWEMLTGKRLFEGETVSHTLADVLREPLDFDKLPKGTPSTIRELLRRCLDRDIKTRLRDIGEARIAIQKWIAEPNRENETTSKFHAPQRRTAMKGGWVPWALCSLLLLVLAGILIWMAKPSPRPAITRFSVTLGEDQVFTNNGLSMVAISPDGTQVVYAANRRLYLRPLAEVQARPISNSDGGVINPVFSPDGKWLSFYDSSDASLRRIAVSGGTAVTICSIRLPAGIDWSEQGVLFAQPGEGIMRVSPNGGRPERLIPARANEQFGWPQMLPGGQAVLFTVAAADAIRSETWDKAQVVVQELKSGTRKVLFDGGTYARYLPSGHVVYAVNGVLFAVRVDMRRRTTTGSPVPIVEGVRRLNGVAQFAFSNTGSMIYIPGPANLTGVTSTVLALVGRKGQVEPLQVPSAGFPRISRDGKQVAYQIDEGNDSSIWIYELSGAAAPRRLTLPGTRSNRYPIWSSNNRRIAFQSDREGDLGIWWQPADGSGAAERLTKADKGVSHIPDSWSPLEQTFSYSVEQNNTASVWVYSLSDKRASVFAEMPGASLNRSVFSPDGRWIAYQSIGNPSRIYVSSFPRTVTAYVAPVDGDTHHPLWSPDGTELFYIGGPGLFGGMRVRTQPTVSFGSPMRLPKGMLSSAPTIVRNFDILPDGKHFIGLVGAGANQSGVTGSQQIQVVLNWFEDIKQRVGK